MQESEIERLFPNRNRALYFNSAGVTLCPTAVKDEVAAYLELLCQDTPGAFARYGSRLERLRRNLAGMMNAASPDEVAVLHHTAEAASVIANGLDWREGDVILTLDREYPSTIYPWRNLAERRGVRLEMLEERGGRVPEEEIVDAIRSRRPRLFAISAVEWCSGYAFDLERLGAACHETGTFFFVDGAQALGFRDVDVRACQIDAFAGSAWKWLFGPAGQGYLYLRRERLGEIAPVFVGSDCVVNHDDYLDYDFTLKPDMRRFEYSTVNLSALVWFDAGVRFVLDLGLEAIRSHVFALQAHAFEQLRGLGCEIRGDWPDGRRSGIMAFRPPRCDSEALSRQLQSEAGILARERDGFVRLAFHVYSTRAGIDRLIDALP